MLTINKTCNSMVRFSKYDFYNKLLDGVILLRVTPLNSHVIYQLDKFKFL